jgi:hypothetical protein
MAKKSEVVAQKARRNQRGPGGEKPAVFLDEGILRAPVVLPNRNPSPYAASISGMGRFQP